MARSIPVAQRDANSARVANQAAESILCQIAHLNGQTFTDDQFEAFQIGLRDIISQQLYRIDQQLHLPGGGDAHWPEPAEREPRTIPATITRI